METVEKPDVCPKIGIGYCVAMITEASSTGQRKSGYTGVYLDERHGKCKEVLE